MKVVGFLLIILTILSCRKKNEFADCENFDKIIGTWIDIDTETGDKLIIENDGIVTSFHNMERKNRYELISCEFKQGTSDFYYIFWIDDNGEHTGFHTNSTFDTLRGQGGAFNHDTNNINYERRYIRVK